MRKKLREDRKRKKISTTINSELWELLDKYVDEVGGKKSRIIEKWISEGLKDEIIIKKLKENNIILPETKL